MWLDTEEYAGLCSAIRTRYGNKIPKEDFILYRNHFYVYTYNRKLHKIIFEWGVEIAGNEDFIAKMSKEMRK